MKYFMDTEFLEGTQKKRFLGITVGETKPTIDLVSIGIVTEDNQKYYAISKDFNLKEAWNRYDIVHKRLDDGGSTYRQKVYWIRENILLPIYLENIHGDERNVFPFSYSSMRYILWKVGKSNKQIAEEVKKFVWKTSKINDPYGIGNWEEIKYLFPVEFYAYFGAYDWVGFCWIFGKMIELPKGFPMYINDLKQIMDENGLTAEWKKINCPDPVGQHNASVDANWNKMLFEKIQSTIKK